MSSSSPAPAPESQTPVPPGVAGSVVALWFAAAGWLQVRILVYLTTAAGVTYWLWKVLGQRDEAFGPRNWQFWVAVAVAVVPAVATLVAYAVPDWRARGRRRRLRDWSIGGDGGRPGHFRLTPYREEDRHTFQRADQAHTDALRWVRACPDQLLYLTGVSGSGKSSVLAAHVVPELRAEAVVIPLRASDDPVGHLRAALLVPGAVWKDAQARKRHEPDAGAALVRAAAEHLGKAGRGLVLVVDQFEEALVGPADAPLLELLKAVADGCGPGCRAVLSLRIEFLGDLSRAGLPPASIDRNCFAVPPFTQAAAQAFLTAGFEHIGRNLLDRVVAEAVALDNLTGRVRPVTLNMVGQMLRRMPGDSRAAVGARPFEAYVRKVLGEDDIRDHALRLLRQLLDDQNRRRHVTVEELAGPGGDRYAADGCLGRLAIPDRGLVRCLNPGERDVGARRWEVSHDFVAAVLGAVLPRLRPGLWVRARPWVAPAALLVSAITLALFLSYEQERREALRAADREAARHQLSTEYGIWVVREEEDGSLAVQVNEGSKLTTPAAAVPLLNRLGRVSALSVRNGDVLRDVEGISGLRSLRTLDLSMCSGLVTVEPLRVLTSLESLDLSWCEQLTSVDPLRGLTALRHLALAGCVKLTSLEPLREMAALQTLSLYGCRGVVDVSPLGGLIGLQTLSLTGCEELASVEPLAGLTALRELRLAGCEELTSVEPLRGLAALQKLSLSGCRNLGSAEPLAGLTELRELNLFECAKLVSVEPLRRLTALRELDLRRCPLLKADDLRLLRHQLTSTSVKADAD